MTELTLTYTDEPVGARAETTPSTDDLQNFCTLENILADGNRAPQHATFEDGYWILGSDFKLFPDQPEGLPWGLFSRQISGEDGTFARPITLTLTLSGLYSSIGISLEFDPYGPTWCADLQIQWQRGGQVIHTQDFQPDDWQYVCYAEVHSFDTVVITFRRMSIGHRYLKLQAMTYGITRIFDSEELYGVDLYQDTDLLSDTVSVNTLDFQLRNKSAINFLFQRKQTMQAKFGDELVGVYYISTSEKTGGNRYNIHTVDLVGLAEMASDHKGGFYDGDRAEDVAADIFGDNIPWTMDEELKDAPVYGHLPIASRRDNAQQLAFALSAMVRTGHGTCIEITRQKRVLQASFDNSENPTAYENGSITSGTLVTAVRVTAHSYTAVAESTTLFEDMLDGDEEVQFSEPACDLQITGGKIVESNANYAVIRGNGGKVVLTGRQYTHTQRVYTRTNPLRGANDADNPVSYESMTLVSPHNVQDVLNACYDYNLRLDKVKGKVLTVSERPGDYVEILTDDGDIRRGHLLSLDYVVSGKLAADVVVLADYEEGNSG